MFQELRGETWVFDDKTITFLDGELVGSTNEFLKWAEQDQNYENFRPIPLYETLAEEAYANYLNSNKVMIKMLKCFPKDHRCII